MRMVIAVLLVLSAACGASPTQPSYRFAHGEVVIAPDVEAAWTLLRSMPSAPWDDGRPVADWLDSVALVEVRVAELGLNESGYAFRQGLVVISPEHARDTPAAVAATIAHEARHVDGSAHACGDGTMDRRDTLWGAWRVHQAVLTWAGDSARAASLETAVYCD